MHSVLISGSSSFKPQLPNHYQIYLCFTLRLFSTLISTDFPLTHVHMLLGVLVYEWHPENSPLPVPLDRLQLSVKTGGSDVSVLKANDTHHSKGDTALHDTLRKGLCVVWFKTSPTPEPSCLSQRADLLPKQIFQPTLPYSKFFHCPDTHLGKHRFDY